ncbi:transposase [Chryseobacterium formosense]|uniref:Transposase n=1 Tax=Chryseobacterium formosense TaxID=236814 RepID=A0A085YZ99_9FLAO|nr:transposase [Chryseobacterium formosense]
MDFKNIHIGEMIEKRVQETNIDVNRICSFLKCTENEIQQMYTSKSIDSYTLLRCSKLLKYDFFRIYSQHILLFTSSSRKEKNTNEKSSFPEFRKNIYTKEIINFILETVNSGKMTKKEVINTYKIPKTTLYKWINKYNKNTKK